MFPSGFGGPRRSFALVPSDAVDTPCSGIWVGGGGTLSIRFHDDSAPQTWLNVPNGFQLTGRIKRVYSTGTTCTNMIGVA